VEGEKPALERWEAEPAGRQDAQGVAVSEERDVPRSGGCFLDDPQGAGADLLGGLSPGTTPVQMLQPGVSAWISLVVLPSYAP
jgi:hypothetical protein